MGGSNSTGRRPRAMPPAEEVDIAAVPYRSPALQAPHLTGFALRAFIWLMESRLLGPLVTSVLKSQNNMPQVSRRRRRRRRSLIRSSVPTRLCLGITRLPVFP
jgi:hypothetical protein